MSNQKLKIFRETALPSRLEPYAIYLINPTERQDYVEMYVTSSTGQAKRHINEADVRTIVNQALSAVGQLVVVQNIAKRNELVGKNGSEVYVLDASGDSTVNSGGARYIYNNNTWIKISETESMDLNLSWETLSNKPNSSVQAIDNAVNLAHTHTNKTQLDKIGEDSSGNLTYGGQAVKTEWASIGW